MTSPPKTTGLVSPTASPDAVTPSTPVNSSPATPTDGTPANSTPTDVRPTCRSAPVHHHPSWVEQSEPWGIDTLLAHAGTSTDPATGAITTPIHLSTTFSHPGLGESTGYDYTRTATPTRDVLQDALARLDGGVAAFALTSGMAAIQLAVTTLAPPGSRVVALEDVYGGTYRYLELLAEQGAYEVDFVVGPEGLRKALERPATLVLIETPTNPMMVQIDIPEAARWAHDAGALLAVDNTFVTPVICRPLELGADVVVYSATKYLGGHNDLMAGTVVVSDPALGERLQYMLNTTGANLGSFDAFLLLRGLKTLALRMERHEVNASRVVNLLSNSPHVTRVLYPGRSGMVSFELADDVDVPTFLASVRVFTFAESLGGVESLLTCPSVQTHADVPPQVRAAYGLSDRLIRLSVGIEDPADLEADLARALELVAT